MKHRKLHSVAHNFANSQAGGMGFAVSHHVIRTNVYSEAAANEHGFILADFLTGKVEGAYPEGEAEYALPLFRNTFPAFCERHEVEILGYSAFLVRFISDKNGNNYVITIEDRNGKRTLREYIGTKGKRSGTLDDLGRRRPKYFKSPLD